MANGSPLRKITVAVPKRNLRQRLALIVIFAAIVLVYVLLFMPRTSFFSIGDGPAFEGGELTAGMSVRQKFSARDGVLKSLLIHLDTFERKNVAEYTVSLLNADGSAVLGPDGSAVQEKFNADKMVYGKPQGIPLPRIETTAGEDFIVEISTDDAYTGNAVGLLINRDGAPYAVLSDKDGSKTLTGNLDIDAGYASFSTNALIAALILIAAVSLAILFWSDKLHVNVLVLALIFGVMFSLITPVWDTPDEGQHSGTAFMMSEGHFSPGSGQITESYDAIKANYLKTFNTNDLGDVERSPNTDRSSWGVSKFFLGFLPQTVGLLLAKLFGANMGVNFYMGRILNAIVYAILAFFAVKYTVRFKLYMAVMALMPMSLVLAGSYNPDALTYGLALLMVAYFSRLCFSSRFDISWKHMLIFMAITVLLVMNKYTLAPLALLPFFIPKKRFCSRKIKWIMAAVIIALSAVGAVFMISLGAGGTSAIAGNTNTQGANLVEQLAFMMQNPGTAVSIFTKSIMRDLGTNVEQLFSLGQLTYNVYGIFVYIYVGFVAVAGLAYTRYMSAPSPADNAMRTPAVSRLWMLFLVLLTIFVTYLALYLTWTPVRADTILGVQGRYFVPLLFLLPFLGQDAPLRVEEGVVVSTHIKVQFAAVIFAAIALLTTILNYY